MNTEEVSFLKDQVHRLTHELSKYRGQGLNIEDDLESPLPNDGPPAPWLTDKGLLSPLLAEYDSQIKEMQHLINAYENELKSLRPEVSRLVQENERLNEKLKDALNSQLPSNGTGDTEPLQGDEEILQNLQMQVETVVQEKEAAVERWHEAEQEIDRLQHQLQEEKNSHQWGVIEQQAQQMQSEYFETVNLLNRELEQVQTELRQTRQELETASLQVKDLRRTNKDLEQQLNWKDQEVAEVIFKEGITDSKVNELKRIMDDRKRRISGLEAEVEEFRRDKQALEVRITEMQKRNSDVANRELEAVAQMREAVQMVETAALEKEQAEVSLQQKDEELEQLREVINKLINEAGARTRQEVDQVRAQSNDRIQKLTEEVHALEMDNSEKQDNLEKAIREKRAAESELEKVYKEGVNQMNKDQGSFENMNKRAINAERARDDANLLVETLQHKLKREEMNAQQLKDQLEGQINNYRERMSSLQQEFENVNDDRVKLLDDMDVLKKKLQSAQQEKEAAQRKYQKEITIYEQENNMKIRDFEVKLQSTEDVNRHSMSELHKLLNGQQRMCARWKEECTSIAQKYETKVTDLRSEMAQLKKRNHEVTKLLKDSQEKTIQAEKMIQDYTRGIQRMEQRMRDSESRAADASKQLSRHILREKQMESERRSLSQELKRSQMDASTKSVRSHPDDLHIADLAASHGSMNGSVRRKGELDQYIEDR
ncbi:sodium channel and clathrin linker 1-like isoform X1 [Ruditapes philippinarum]|uniref:sodium channel and clathrin linker 1-like isoform X1 n=1 Tax=Ruditapes philippinarum TaxID=129788 RepID=UPI00295B1912|nr:sodium channel and clathrin linker 1-like isoform X1 [Ruditapes philippinarum]